MNSKSLTHRQYFAIALPFIVSTVTQPLLGAVDTAVVGHLDSPIYIGGVAIGTVILNTLYWLFGFLRVSTTSQSAMALGTKKKEDITASLVRPFTLAAGIGLLFVMLQIPIWHVARSLMAPESKVAEQAGYLFFNPDMGRTFCFYLTIQLSAGSWGRLKHAKPLSLR